MSVDISGTPPYDLVGDLDQQEGGVRVRRIAEQVVRDHDERSFTGVVTPLPDPKRVVDEPVSRVAGVGSLQQFLDDSSVEGV